MTPEEKWIAQGRVRDECKQVKEAVVTLRADISHYARRMEEAHAQFERLLDLSDHDPGPTGRTPAEYVIEFCRDFVSAEIEPKVRKFGELSAKLAKLEKQVAEFG